MGQCYSVKLKIKLKQNSEKRAADALKAHMFKDDRTNYCFDEFAALGVGTEELDDLIRICLAGWKLTTYFTDENIMLNELDKEMEKRSSKIFRFSLKSWTFSGNIQRAMDFIL